VKPYRREFERLEIEEDALALDEDGRELGRVSLVSGGGFQINTGSLTAAERLVPGKRMIITVVEPNSGIRNVFPVEIVYREGEIAGAKFVALG
jgi:hypothetical protein